MIVLLAVAIATGVLTAYGLASISWVAAVIGAPLVASFAAVLAGSFMAWQNARRERHRRALEAQTGVMVAALRDVTIKAASRSPAPKVSRRRGA